MTRSWGFRDTSGVARRWLALAATVGGCCVIVSSAQAADPGGASGSGSAPAADGIRPTASVFDPRAGYLEGFLYAEPSGSTFRPGTLTVWLPKRVTLPPAGAKVCSESKARNMTSSRACTQLAGGKLRDDRFTAWFAYAGPEAGGRRRVWLKVREETEEGGTLTGFSTGVLERTSGRFGSKLVLRLGTLGIKTTFMEYVIGKFRAGGCPSGGWRYRVQLKTPEATTDRTRTRSCS